MPLPITSLSLLLAVKGFKLAVALRLLATLLDEVANGITSQYFFVAKDLVEILLEVLAAFFDVLG